MKKAVVGKATPAATAVLRQANAIAPRRMRASDGILPSAAHLKANPTSDHNTGLAVDLTHDPKNGIDCEEIFEQLKKDRRVSYLIFNKRIWSRERKKEGNRKYSGSNPHTKHIHISINPDYANDTSPWFPWINQPSISNQLKSRLKPLPKKKPQTKTKCTHCKLHCDN